MEPSSQQQVSSPQPMRLPIAIGLAGAAGVPAGVFFNMSAVPFGPVLLGAALMLGGAVFFTMILGLWAGRRHITIGLSYAASVAIAALVAGVVTRGVPVEWWHPFAQIGAIFAITGGASLFGSVPFALGPWLHSD